MKAILRLFKLPRLLRIGRLLKYLARFKYAGAIKILKFVFMLILIAHWSGCFFFFLMQIESEYGHGTWLEHNVGHIQEGENLTARYLTALYSGFLMLIGEGMDMETSLETFYGSLMVLVGTIVTALLSHDARLARGRRRRGVHKLREQGPDHVAPGSLPQVGLQRRRLRGRAGGRVRRSGGRAGGCMGEAAASLPKLLERGQLLPTPVHWGQPCRPETPVWTIELRSSCDDFSA